MRALVRYWCKDVNENLENLSFDQLALRYAEAKWLEERYFLNMQNSVALAMGAEQNGNGNCI